MQPSYQNTPPFGVSNIPVLGGISGAFGIVDPSRSSGFGDPFRRMNVPSSGKVTFQCLSATGSLVRVLNWRSSEQIVSVLDCYIGINCL